MIDIDLTLSLEEVLPWLKIRGESVLTDKLKGDIEKAVKEVLELSTVSYGYNLSVDTDFFDFEKYAPPFPLKRLSLACVSLGRELDSMFAYYSKKGEDGYRYILENAANALVEKVADYVNFLICSSRQKGEKQSFRKSPGVGRVPIEENRPIANYLHADQIGIKVSDNFMLIPRKSVIFFVEWADLSVKSREFSRRCGHCGQSPCIYRS